MSKKHKLNKPFLIFTKITGILGAVILFKPKIYYVNKERQGRKLHGPCILMSNHTSLMDFVLYMLVFYDSSMHFWMAEILFKKNKLFSWLLYSLGGIKVDRQQYQLGFISESLEVLDRGGILGVFPQGRLPVNGRPFPFQPGIVMTALKTDAPIIPVYTDGNYGIGKGAHVMIGEPIDIHALCREENPSLEEIKRLTQILEEQTYALGRELDKRMEQISQHGR